MAFEPNSYLNIMDEFRVKAKEIKASLKLSNSICHKKLRKVILINKLKEYNAVYILRYRNK